MLILVDKDKTFKQPTSFFVFFSYFLTNDQSKPYQRKEKALNYEDLNSNFAYRVAESSLANVTLPGLNVKWRTKSTVVNQDLNFQTRRETESCIDSVIDTPEQVIKRLLCKQLPTVLS